MLASVIIPVYKRADWLTKSLSALQRQTLSSGTWEAIVIDDGSPNEKEIRQVVERIAAESDYSLIFRRKQNGGPAAARNFGARFAGGGILCFLDDDSIPQPRWLEEITAPFHADDQVGLVSGQTLSYERQEGLSLSLERAIYAGKCWATCNIAYRREVFERLEGFDETFPEPSWEDNDLGLRARWAGYTHVYSEKAEIFHPHEQSLSEYRAKCLLNGRGMAVFCRKYWRTKPLWGLGAPLLMARRLVFALSPFTWIRRECDGSYVKFYWSFYSVQGFVMALLGKHHGKNKAR